MKPKALKNVTGRPLIIGGLVGGFIFLWYIQPYPWLAVAMGLLSGLLVFGILASGRIEKWRRVFFIAIMALSAITLLANVFYFGTTVFKQSVSAWNPGYYFPGTAAEGAMPFPTPVVMPAIFWRGARFIAGFGVWQTAIPTSIGALFVFMVPVILIFAIFGRGLCGWVCPLGGLPELSAAAGREWWKLGLLKEKRTSGEGVVYVVPKRWVLTLRYFLLAFVVILSLAAGFALVNIFYPVLWLKSMPAFWAITGVLVFSAVALPLVTRRRWWCFVCPVGAILSACEKTSLFRIHINQEKCVKCLDCVRACRYYALNPQGVEKGKCEGDLCVRCGRCIEACSEEAIDFTLFGGKWKTREAFLASTTAIAFAFYAWFAIQSVYLISKLGNFRWFR